MQKRVLADIRGVNFAYVATQTFLVLCISQVLYLVVSIITARMLGPSGKGITTIFILYPTLLFTIGHLSVYRAITVHVAEDKYRFSDFPGSVLAFALAASAVLMAGFVTVFFSHRQYFIQNASFALILAALTITPFSMITQTFSSILQAKGRIDEFNIVQLAQAGSMVICIAVALLVLKSGVTGTVWAYVAANLLTCLTAVYFVSRIAPRPWNINTLLIRRLVIDGMKLHLGVIASFIFLKIDMLMLSYYRRPESVGYYAIAVAMADLIMLAPTALQHVFFSKFSSMINDKMDMAKKTILVYKHAILLSLVFACLLALFARPIVLLIYGADFFPSIKLFLILLPGVWFFWQNNILVYYMVGNKRFLLISLMATFGSLINVVLNCMFIPRQGAIGAAVASLITYFILGVVYFFFFLWASGYSFKNFGRELMVRKEDAIFYSALLKSVFKGSTGSV